jgi:hypothetical protein
MIHLVLALLLAPAAQGSDLPGTDLTPAQQQEIIDKFSAKESEFAAARENYTYRQSYKIEEIGPGGRPSGKFEMVADIIFTAEGKRTERVVYAPMNTLQRIIMTPQDEEDMRNVQPFVLSTKDVAKYHVRYLGRESVDEVPCFVFAVKPKQMVAGERYFAGMVWVDDRDLQIVKSYGRGVGIEKKGGDHKYPKFETYREQIDGRFWFPTYTVANDSLMFATGPVPIKMVVTYKDYKQFRAETKIIFGDEVKPADPPKKQ